MLKWPDRYLHDDDGDDVVALPHCYGHLQMHDTASETLQIR